MHPARAVARTGFIALQRQSLARLSLASWSRVSVRLAAFTNSSSCASDVALTIGEVMPGCAICQASAA